MHLDFVFLLCLGAQLKGKVINMKRLLIVLLLVLIVISGIILINRWQYIAEMRYCSFALDGHTLSEEPLYFETDGGQRYIVVPFPKEMNRESIVDILSDMNYSDVNTKNSGEYQVYYNPFGEGEDFAVFVPPFDSFPSLFETKAVPFAYYVQEIE